MLGRRIAARQPPPTCLPELRRALLDEWCNIPQDQIDTLILSMPRRFAIVTLVTCIAIDIPSSSSPFGVGHARKNWAVTERNQVDFSEQSRFSLDCEENRICGWRSWVERRNPALAVQWRTLDWCDGMECHRIQRTVMDNFDTRQQGIPEVRPGHFSVTLPLMAELS
ncbi:RNase H domain-containing protein [Trichonephila clavipes]|uniref:RNase H domain-containing protein n=1 Tax=Trichonephila clavipes TaxID=2585209 RepID=A0A8X6RJW1_TRICX|nr:RNase H domain-containing protein [Trichonephila clavipes]